MAELSGQLDMETMLSGNAQEQPMEGYDENGNLMDYNPRTGAFAQEASAGSAGLASEGCAPAGRACTDVQRRDCCPDVYAVIPAEDADRLRYLAAGIRSDFDAAKERVLHAGMLLMEARNRCPQGRWLEWLNKEAGCPERTAQQAMQLYETYGARELPEAYGKLDASHLVELLRAPEEDRDALAAKAAEEAMSTRALREEIKRLREDHAQAQVKIHDLITEQEQMAEGARTEKERFEADMKKAREAKRLAEARAKDAVARANNSAEALRLANAQLEDLKNREPETVEVERVPDDVAAELERLRAELEKSRANDGEVTHVKEIEIKLRISWYQLTRGFEELLTLVAQLNQRDPDKGKNYVGAVMKLCDAMKAKVDPQ